MASKTDFNVNLDDLAFILRNIKVAEAHSGGMTLQAAIQAEYGVDPNDANILPAGLRTVSGAYNNLAPGRELWGAADTAFPRLTDPSFVTTGEGSIDFDGPFGPAPAMTQGNYGLPGNVIDSTPRTISNLIVNQTVDNPAAVSAWFANPLALDAFHERYGTDTIPVDPHDIAVGIVDASFEETSLADFALGVISDPRGNYTTTAPEGWTIAGAGGLFAPVATITAAAGHSGNNVAYLQGGSTLSQTMAGVVLEAGGSVSVTLNIGDRTDMTWTGGEVRLVDADGNVLATLALPDPGDGQWTSVRLDSGPVPAFSHGLGVRIEIANTGSNQILIDDVAAEVLGRNEIAVDSIDIANIPNQSPDIGLSPSYNSWMTFFGQFFDHGLDLVTKTDNGTVYMPLKADDPLIAGADGQFGTADDLPPHLRFMAMTRAKVDANGNAENTTTPFIDQNQTYTSHASHQVFLREYQTVDLQDGRGPRPLATGHLLDGQQAGTIATWADVKLQAREKLGIELNDFDVHGAPLLVTDEYGEFVRGPNGYPLMVLTDGSLREGNPAAPVSTEGAVSSGHQFLVDIAHHAGPGFADLDHNPATPAVKQVADFDLIDANGDGVSDSADVAALPGILTDANNDGVIDELDLADVNLDGTIDAADLVADDHNPLTYDDEMLDAHYLSGDGRGNENIALTAVHSVFHAEHNRMVEENKLTILQSAADGDVSFLNEWLLVDVAEVPADTSTLVWDGERMFQAARFTTEMQYQHLVFEEFARRIQPNVDPFVFTNTPDMDPSIIAEFAHTVYRFGHSMLTDTVDLLDNDLNPLAADGEQATLIEAFLNPQMFAASGADVGEIIANVVRGAVGDVGNEIDEFVVPALQSNLLGLPLDLAALNIARGRETGIKSLNEIRKEFYGDYGHADLKPYTSWLDFGQHMKHPASLVNFIAAYGTHATITGADTIEAKRAAAWELLSGKTLAGEPSTLDTADRLDFLNARGTYATVDLGGMNNVDLWIGGLAEELNEFGGMLGSTFNFVFEYQMEHLQTGDRFYYLSRTQGTNLLNQLEPNTFTDLVMRNSDLSDPHATHLNGSLFVTPDYVFELDTGIAQPHGAVDPEHDDAFLQMIDPKVVRDYTNSEIIDGHVYGGTLKFSGGEHVVLGGTEGKDSLYGDKGIDTLWGDGDDDYLNAGMESDNVFGGAGNDIIEDPFGDDVLRGGEGDDVISAGSGLDLIFGDEGSDFIIMGMDDKEAFGGEDNDFMLGGTGNELVQGGEGDDWLEGGDGFDTLAGDNSQLFFNSTIVGHDVMWGQGNDTDYDGESGDDIMLSGPGIQRFNGMFGFDWAIAKHDPQGVDFDFGIPLFVNDPGFILRDRFDLVEGGSGWIHDDTIAGDDRGNFRVDVGIDAAWEKHQLDKAGIDRIEGLAELLGMLDDAGMGAAAGSTFRDGNILLGGGGSDRLQGNGGYDVIDGDAWLNVRLAIGPDANGVAAPVDSAESLAELVPYMLNGTIKPSQISIVREILYDNAPGDIDTAIYRGTRAEYQIEGADTMEIDGQQVFGIGIAYDANNDGFITVRDMDDGVTGATVDGVTLISRNLAVDNTDKLKNIERLEFSDQTFTIGLTENSAIGRVTINDPTLFNDGTQDLVTPYVGQTLTASLTDLFDIDGVPLDGDGNPVGLTFEWQQMIQNGNTGWQTIGTGLSYVVQPGTAGQIMRAVAVFEDATGTVERIGSGATEKVELPLAVNEESPAGTVVADRVPFNFAEAGVPQEFVSHSIVAGQDAGGRFAIVQNGIEASGAPRYSIVVAEGAPRMDYETQDASQIVDNQYQIVVESVDTRDGTVIATRQLTVLLNDVPENLPPILAVNGNNITLSDDFDRDLVDGRNTMTGWVETDDGTSGATGGQIRIDRAGGGAPADALNIMFGNGAALSQTIDMTGAVAATLHFDYSEYGLSPMETVTIRFSATGDLADLVTLHTISGDGGGTGTLATDTNTATGTVALDLTGPFGANTLLVIEAPSIANTAGRPDFVSIDNMRLDLLQPQDQPVRSIALSFIEDDPALAVMPDPVISDPNGRSLVSAKVVLTNAMAQDALVLGAGGPIPGFAVTVDTSIPGIITASITATAPQSQAAFAAQLADVRFVNTAGHPDQTPRVIETTVNNGIFDSAPVITTVSVTDVEHPAIANNDVIVARTSAFDVPTWALMVNDVDADGDLFEVTETYGAVGLTASQPSGGLVSVAVTAEAGRFNYRVTDGDPARASVSVNATGNLTGNAGSDIIIGSDLGETIIGRRGDDVILGGDGNDSILWGVNARGVTDGRDIVDGGAGMDTFTVTGNATAEDFQILTRAEAIAADHVLLHDATEIVVLRNGEIIAELDNIEEIVVNTLNGPTPLTLAAGATAIPNGDTITVAGDFDMTSLAYNTIHINGSNASDAVDISGLSSDHRIVFDTRGGNDTVIGDLRPQDQVLRPGDAPAAGQGATPPATGGNVPDAIPGTALTGDDDDVVFAGGEVDIVMTHGGADMIFGDDGIDRILAGAGDDYVVAGGGADLVFGGAGDDTFVATAGDGNDVYHGDDVGGGDGSDTLDMAAMTADATVDLGTDGNLRGSAYSAQTGHDVLYGIENVVTGFGNDVITASTAVNVIDGGEGMDIFRFTSVAAIDGDTLAGFQPGDTIDVSGIDANAGQAGNQAFTLTSGALTGAGQLMISEEVRDGDVYTIVQGTTDEDDVADFTLAIRGSHTLTSGDFNL